MKSENFTGFFARNQPSQTQIFSRSTGFAVDQVRLDDLINVRFVDVGVPGTFRINDAHRPFFAAVQTAGLVDADLAFTGKAQFLDSFSWRNRVAPPNRTDYSYGRSESGPRSFTQKKICRW